MRVRQSVSVRAALALAGSCWRACRSPAAVPATATAAAARKPNSKKAATRPAEPTIDPAVVEANTKMASGVPMGTSTAPLEVRFDLASVPRPGETFEVAVAVLPAAPAPVLRLEVTGGEGLTIVEPDGSVAFEKVAGGVRRPPQDPRDFRGRRHPPRAGPGDAGTPGGPESRVFAFPVVIGGQATAAPAPPTKAAH